ncbi:MAG TPA: hypothetical protein VGC88_02070 [Terriglobales bacterium]|jgi:hypothetical protein
MDCPQCACSLTKIDAAVGTCPHCGCGVCVPRAYFVPAEIGSALFTLAVMFTTYHQLAASRDAAIAWLMWTMLILVTWLACSAIFGELLLWLAPPKLLPASARDYTALRLDK